MSHGTLLGTGIFGWDRGERITNRYGSFVLGKARFPSSGEAASAFINVADAQHLAGNKVRVRAVVKESRRSGHIGDFALGIRPTQPEVGEVVDLGVGTLLVEDIDWAQGYQFVLAPNDGRDTFWLDPRKLYRLHDQTVEVYVEVTEDDSATDHLV